MIHDKMTNDETTNSQALRSQIRSCFLLLLRA